MNSTKNKIFLSVGSNTPFDRLIKCIDQWAKENPNYPIFAQIGQGEYIPQHMEWVVHLAYLIIELNSTKLPFSFHIPAWAPSSRPFLQGKALVTLPRRAKWMEMRNDHQVATANHFKHKKGIYAAMDEEELLNFLKDPEVLTIGEGLGDYATPELLETLKGFIQS